ncbi:hypothetical protein LJR034_009347 [Caballeronia sp. LjRoot34]
MATLLGNSVLRQFAIRRLAAINVQASYTLDAQVSWTHAGIECASGERRDGWLRTDDAMVFTAYVRAEVAMRLARGEGQPGACPAHCSALNSAEACGAELILSP